MEPAVGRLKIEEKLPQMGRIFSAAGSDVG
jgi:hypothetical protein